MNATSVQIALLGNLRGTELDPLNMGDSYGAWSVGMAGGWGTLAVTPEPILCA